MNVRIINGGSVHVRRNSRTLCGRRVTRPIETSESATCRSCLRLASRTSR